MSQATRRHNAFAIFAKRNVPEHRHSCHVATDASLAWGAHGKGEYYLDVHQRGFEEET